MFISSGYTEVKNITFTSIPNPLSTPIHLSKHPYNVDKRIFLSNSGVNVNKIIYIDTDDIDEQKYVLAYLSMDPKIINVRHEYILKSNRLHGSNHSVYFTNRKPTADISYFITDSQDHADIIVITK